MWTVQEAKAKLSEAQDLVDVAVANLAKDPLLFLCAPEAGCDQCAAARASIPSDWKP